MTEPDKLPLRIGKILLNLHALEFTLRTFLYEKVGPKDATLNLDQLSVDEWISENPITDYDSLGDLISKVNERLEALDIGERIDNTLVALRDAFAHGRIISTLPSGPYFLVKFSSPSKRKVRVTTAINLTPDWLTEQARHAFDEVQKVVRIARDQGVSCFPLMEKHPSGIKPESWLVSAGRASEPGAPLNVPPIPASNFIIGGEREYSRDDGTPTWEALEEMVGGLESGKAVAFASGMAAIASVFDQLAAGAVVVLPDDCYQGVAGLAAAGADKRRWSVQRVPVDDTAGWIRACGIADLVWLESPSNPLLTVADLEAICAGPRKQGTIVAVDNTFATPLNQQPLVFGATVSLQSATKFIGGHSDLLAGVATTNDDALWRALRRSRELTGATPGTLEAFLAVRGARTLALRLERAQQTAMLLAERLEMHPLVTRVRYPGLFSHPTHAVAKRLLKGFGTIISFDVRGGAEVADAVCRHVRLIRHATSLGAVESTIERRAAIPGQHHLPPSLLRLSVGIENANDLWEDLDSAMRSVAP